MRSDGWDEARRTTFLNHLAATANVRAAAKAANSRPHNAYALRSKDPEFARQWQEALDTGYARIEAELIRRALGEGGDTENPPQTPVGEGVATPQIDVDLGLRLLKQRTEGGRNARPGGPPKKPGDAEETDAALWRRIAAIQKRRTSAGE